MSQCSSERRKLTPAENGRDRAIRKRDEHRVSYPDESKTLNRLNAKIEEWKYDVRLAEGDLNVCLGI